VTEPKPAAACVRALIVCLSMYCLVSQASPLPDYPFVTASGKAEVWMAPDIGEFQFDVVAEHADAAQALATMEHISSDLGGMWSQRGIEPGDIEAFDLSKKTLPLNQARDGDPATAQVIARHFKVRVRQLASWPELLAAVLGRDGIDNLRVAFDRSDRQQIDAKLTFAAARDARDNAGALAAAFDRKPGAVVAISQAPFDRLGVPFGFGALDGRGKNTTPLTEAQPPADPLALAVPAAIAFTQAVSAVFRLK